MKRLCAAAVLLCCHAAAAANHYVRAGASGNGTDWSNACGRLPDSLVRGDTYYVADGKYPGHVFADPIDGARLITVRKATAADHGTSTGWEADYGDGVAEWGNITFRGVQDAEPWRKGSYCVFDGVTGSGESGYGFKIPDTWGSGWAGLMTVQYGPSDVTIAHVELEGRLQKDATAEGDRGINWTQSESSSNIVIRNCYMHDIAGPHILVSGGGHVLVEQCLLYRNKSTPTAHAAAIVGYYNTHHVTVRHNRFRDQMGTAVITMDGSYWDIYGNLFCNTPATAGSYCVGNGIIATAGASGTNRYAVSASYVNVYNNTFANFTAGNSGVYPPTYTHQQVRTFNNIWYNCCSPSFSPGVEHDYNSFFRTPFSGTTAHEIVKDTDPFENAASLDFRLRAPSDPGLPLEPAFNKDWNGAIRGADRQWDRGALEYGGQLTPGAPANLRVR